VECIDRAEIVANQVIVLDKRGLPVKQLHRETARNESTMTELNQEH